MLPLAVLSLWMRATRNLQGLLIWGQRQLEGGTPDPSHQPLFVWKDDCQWRFWQWPKYHRINKWKSASDMNILQVMARFRQYDAIHKLFLLYLQLLCKDFSEKNNTSAKTEWNRHQAKIIHIKKSANDFLEDPLAAEILCTVESSSSIHSCKRSTWLDSFMTPSPVKQQTANTEAYHVEPSNS